MKLTVQQQDLLDECELVITQHEESFLKVASALAKIKHEKLWAGQYETFDDYCAKRWGWTERRVRQIIQGNEAIKQIDEELEKKGEGKTVGNAFPGLSQRAAVEISRVEPERRLEVLQAVSEAGAVTGPAIREAAKPKDEPDVVLDGTGYPIPEKRLALWKRGAEVKLMLDQISDVRCAIRKAMNDSSEGKPDLLFARTNLSSILVDLDSAYRGLKCAIPWAVCPDCQGQRASSCMTCAGMGLVSKSFWDSPAIPVESKQLRELSVKK